MAQPKGENMGGTKGRSWDQVEREQDPGPRLQALGLKHISSYCKGKDLRAGEDPSYGTGVALDLSPSFAGHSFS